MRHDDPLCFFTHLAELKILIAVGATKIALLRRQEDELLDARRNRGGDLAAGEAVWERDGEAVRC